MRSFSVPTPFSVRFLSDDDFVDEIEQDVVDSALLTAFVIFDRLVRLAFDDKDDTFVAVVRLSIDDCDDAMNGRRNFT